jgi:hypothetical protein
MKYFQKHIGIDIHLGVLNDTQQYHSIRHVPEAQSYAPNSLS